MKKSFIALVLLLFAGLLARGQSIVQAEYFFDTDAGYGHNKLVSISPGADNSASFNVDVSNTTKGYHILYIRTKDNQGNWSQTTRLSVDVLPAPDMSTIVNGEYFIDVDKGYGANTAFSSTPNAGGNAAFSVSTAGITPGYHFLFVRTKDIYGNWSQTTRNPIQVLPAANDIVAGEYFIDTDPGFGAGTAITIGTPSTNLTKQFTSQVASLTEGYHKMYIRLKDAYGYWSQTIRQNIEIIKQPGELKIIAAEFFFKKDPGIGGAISLTIPQPQADGSLVLGIPAGTKSADVDTLYIRIKDNLNNWSFVTSQKIIKAAQKITFAALPVKKYGNADFDAAATSNSALPVSYTSSDTTIASIVANKIHIKTAGTVIITASQAGNISFLAAAPVSQSLKITKATQTISFAAIPATVFGSPDIKPGATASSGLTVSYTSSDTSVARILNGKIHINHAGSVIITASQAGNINYSAAVKVTRTLTIAKANQVITFAALSSKVYGTPDFALGATASSGLVVSYASADTTVATVVSGSVHIKKAGSSLFTASQAGNTDYNAAPAVAQTLTITKAGQTISFAAIPSKVFGTADFSPGAKASSGLSVIYTSSDTSVAVMIAGKVHIKHAGIASIKATQPGSANYNPATAVTRILTVSQASQVITFAALPGKLFGAADFDPGATSSSDLPVSYTSSDPSVVTIVNGNVHIKNAGTVVVTALQAGNIDYSAAAAVSRTLNISRASQAITFAVLTAKTLGAADFSPGAKSSSGLAVSYSSSDTSVASIVAGNIHLKAVGTSVISATQAGNANYKAAPVVNRTLTVKKPTGISVESGKQNLVAKQEANIESAPSVSVQQAISPNGDGFNDVLLIDGIKSYPENKVMLLDRNGTKIFERTGYNNEKVIFDGRSSITGKLQQQGTYFYLLEYKINNEWKRKTGFFVLKY